MKNNKNIAMVAYTYYVSDPRVKKEAEALAEDGYSVDFFCLKKPVENSFQTINGVNIYRINCQHYRGKSNIKYLLSYMGFFLWVFFKLSYMFIKRGYRLIHINNMPDLLVFTAIVPKIFGSKIILDIHDVMSEVFLYKNPNSNDFLIKMLKIQECISARFADRVLSVDKYHKKVIESHGINMEKITVVSNFPDKDLFKPIAIENKEKNLFKLIFHGTISKVYGLETIIEGIYRIKDKIPGLEFRIIGEGDYESEISDLIQGKKLQDFISFNNKKIPHEQIPSKIADADLGIVSCPDITAIYQNKFLEYISMGIPTLIEYNNEVYKFYRNYNLEFYKKNNPDSFAQKLYYLYTDKERYNELKNTSVELSKKFRWGNEKLKYINLVKSLIPNRKR